MESYCIYQSKNIIISNNVWLGAHVRIMKGANIASHTVIGNSSLVNKKLEEPYSIYACIPARKIKDGVDWARSKKASNK